MPLKVTKRTWSSKKYKKAAHRHYKTCRELIEKIDSSKRDTKPHLVANIFYLSGYILECIFKSYILDVEHCKNELTLDQLDKKGLKTHNIQQLWKKIDSGIKKSDFKWCDLSQKWDVDARYDISAIEITELKSHFNSTVTPIYLKINEQY